MDKNLRIAIQKAFPAMEKFFTEKSLLKFLNAPASHLEKYNFGLGTMMRLKLLRPKHVLYRKFVQKGLADKDEMTLIVIKEFHKTYQFLSSSGQ